MKILSSNQNKIYEFERILNNLINVEVGPDIKEIDGSAFDIIIYKSLHAGQDTIVEDTVLYIDDKLINDIKWATTSKLKRNINRKVTWEVNLGLNIQDEIRVFQGHVHGIIVEPRGEGFGFDAWFKPDGSDLTLGELQNKDTVSARYNAVYNLLFGEPEVVVNKNKILPYIGKYQNEKEHYE